MGRTLILIESLAAVLLLVALVTAGTSRWRNGLLRWSVPLLVALLVAAPAAVTVYLMSFLNRLGTVSTVSYLAVFVWTVLFVFGALIVIASGLRVREGNLWSLRTLTVAFLAAVALTAITVSNLDVAAKSQLAAVRVEAGAKAQALSPPRLPDGQNAASTYRRAFAALTQPEQLPVLLQDRAPAWQNYDRQTFNPNDQEQKAFLESQQRGLTLLREAAAMPQCSFDRDWSSETSPVDLLVPELPYLQHGATLLAYDALARASRGDAKGATDNIAAIFGIVRHIRYPLLIDLLTATRLEQTGARALEDVLSLAPPKPEDLARLTPAGEPFREHLRRTFAMEEAWGMAAIVMLATGQVRDSPELQSQTRMDAFGAAMLDSPLYRVFFLEDDLAIYRKHLRTMRENAAKPAPAALDGFREQEHLIKSTRGGGVLSGLLLPASWRVLYATLDGDARRALVRLALAATAYKAKHGKYPESATALVPDFLTELPADPYDGRPIRLKPADKGLLLYSIGRDRKDDGGQPEDDTKEKGDLLFHLR